MQKDAGQCSVTGYEWGWMTERRTAYADKTIVTVAQRLSQVERSGYITDCCVCVLLLCLHWLCLCLFCPVAEYLQAVQATSVLACVFAILALFVFVAQLFTLPKGQRFTFTGVLQLIACK